MAHFWMTKFIHYPHLPAPPPPTSFLLMGYTLISHSLCQALSQCRRANKVHKQQKMAGREEGRACKHLLKYLNPPTNPLISCKHVKMPKCARRDSCEFAGWTSCVQSFPRWPSRPSFKDQPVLPEIYDMSLMFGTKVPKVSLFTVKFVVSRSAFCKFWRDFGFSNHNPICCKNKTENNSWLFKIAKEIARYFCQGTEADFALFLQVRNTFIKKDLKNGLAANKSIIAWKKWTLKYRTPQNGWESTNRESQTMTV